MRISDWSSDVCSSDLIARKGDDAMKQVLHAHMLAWRQEHRRACRRAMPIQPCLRQDGDHLVKAQLTLPEHVENDIERHNLRLRGGRYPLIGALGEKNESGRKGLQIGERRERKRVEKGK